MDQFKGIFFEVELNWYVCYMMLCEIGGFGQKKFKNVCVFVIGVGGFGFLLFLYLVVVGVGIIGVVDDDVVDGSNLQWQVIYSDDWIGMFKVYLVVVVMWLFNFFIEVKFYNCCFSEEDVWLLFVEYDLIFDGMDNFEI